MSINFDVLMESPRDRSAHSISIMSAGEKQGVAFAAEDEYEAFSDLGDDLYDKSPTALGGVGGGGFKTTASTYGSSNTANSNAFAQRYRILGTFSIVAIAYFASCGGPVGSEPLVSSVGPFVGLVAIPVYVVLCYLPFAYMVAELCSAFPENGGYVIWVKNAFGSFWGLQVGCWSWIAGVMNNAIYPGLIYSTVTTSLEIQATSSVVEYFIKVGIAIVFALPTLIGVPFVASGARLVLMAILTIFAIFCVWSFVTGKHAFERLADVRKSDQDGGIDWANLINYLFWSFDGIYEVSVIGGEILNPARTYSRAIAITCGLTVISFLLPLISTVVANAVPWIELNEDSYPSIAEAIGGKILHHLVLAAAVLSTIAMFTSTLFCQSFMVCGAAEAHMLPPALGRRHQRFETPYVAVLTSLVPTIILAGFDLDTLLEMTNAFGAGVQLAIVMTLLQLRRSYPYLPRPTKVPGGFNVLCMLVIFPTIVFGYIVVTTVMTPLSALLMAVFIIPGVIYGLIDRRRRHKLRALTQLQEGGILHVPALDSILEPPPRGSM